MKEMLGNLASGQIEFYKAVRDLFLASVVCLSTSRPWKNGIELYPSFNEYAWTFKYVYLLVVPSICVLSNIVPTTIVNDSNNSFSCSLPSLIPFSFQLDIRLLDGEGKLNICYRVYFSF